MIMMLNLNDTNERTEREDLEYEKKGFALPQCIIIYNGFTDDNISALEMCAMS